MSKSDAMARCGIMSLAPLEKWCRAYREGGAEALRPKPKGRPRGSGAKAPSDSEVSDAQKAADAVADPGKAEDAAKAAQATADDGTARGAAAHAERATVPRGPGAIELRPKTWM